MIKIISNIFLNNKLQHKLKLNITPLGRWNIENNKKKIDIKIDLSNEDHCGPCGQYILDKRKDTTIKMIEKHMEKNFEKNFEKPMEKNFEKNFEKPMEKNFEKPMEKNFEKPIEKNFEKPMEKNNNNIILKKIKNNIIPLY